MAPGATTGAPPVGDPLLARLPSDLQSARIVSISMQDHYAEVTTTQGKALLLIRLRDAIDLVDGCAGTQVHRSHGVAAEAMRGVRQQGRRWEVLLADGRRLPVGKTCPGAVQTPCEGGEGASDKD